MTPVVTAAPPSGIIVPTDAVNAAMIDGVTSGKRRDSGLSPYVPMVSLAVAEREGALYSISVLLLAVTGLLHHRAGDPRR